MSKEKEVEARGFQILEDKLTETIFLRLFTITTFQIHEDNFLIKKEKKEDGQNSN